LVTNSNKYEITSQLKETRLQRERESWVVLILVFKVVTVYLCKTWAGSREYLG
jgi:hypothetical protein